MTTADLTSMSRDDLLKVLLEALRRIAILEAKLLTLTKRVQTLEP